MKTQLPIDVHAAAIERLGYIFDRFERVCVSFSGGKDSTVLLHLAHQVAQERGRTIDAMFIDWEAQYDATIAHVEEMLSLPGINPIWIALPISTSNESSFHDPMWTAWDIAKQDLWVRPLPSGTGVIADYDHFPFYDYGMTFEEFVPLFNEWYSQDAPAAFLIGIRADESLNRFRTVKKQGHKGVRKTWQDIAWSTQSADQGWNFYPLYDWRVEDIWTNIGRDDVPYNHIYDMMYLAGMSLHEMRICEPYSMEARKHLDKYHYLEPKTWDRIVQRVGGANFGAKYGRSELFAFQRIEKPDGLTWKEYSHLLLESLPPPLRDHYRRRIDVFLGWFQKNLGWEDLNEESDPKLEAKKLGGSWRMVARALLRNDYFCSHLSFSINKDEYRKLEDLKQKYKVL